MRQPLAILLVGAVAALLARPVMADINPPIGLAAGSEYQLIFVTADATTATSTAIGDYNAFATTDAARNASLPSTTWDAVVSTATVNANANAPNVMVDGSYLPVYNTQGIEVSGALGLYANGASSAVEYTQFGNSPAPAYEEHVWSGSDFEGDGITGSTLGGPGVVYLGDYESAADWIYPNEVKFSNGSLPIYALSGPITFPNPEPAAFTLLGSALCLPVFAC